MVKSDKDERIYFSTSERLAGDLSEMILKVGHRPSFEFQDPKTAVKEDGSIIKSNYLCYRIRECNSTTATVFKKEYVPYSGKVNDLTLERNHIMYIRRNGKCFWGSNCICYCITILKTEDEFWSLDDDAKSVNEVTDVPHNFKDWINDNSDRIEAAEKRGTLPYFIRDNKNDVDVILHPELRKKSILERAAERHATRKPEDIEKIQSDWNHSRMNALRDMASRIGMDTNKDFSELMRLLEDDNALSEFDFFKKDYKSAKAMLDKVIADETASAKVFMSDPANASNMAAFAKAMGINQGDLMTFHEADSLRGNPNYAASEIYRVNCQTCVVANELRRRGFDIEALGNTKGSLLEKLSYNTNHIWRDADGNIPEKTIIGAHYVKKQNPYHPGKYIMRWEKTCANRKQLIQQLESSITEDGRYHIEWAWNSQSKRSIPGHIITLERIDGKLRYYDPQNGSVIANFHNYINDIMLKRGIKVLRVDDKRIDVDWACKILEKSGGKVRNGIAGGGGVTGTDIKADIAEYIKRRNAAETNKERVKLDIDMIKNGGFIRSNKYSTSKGSIFATEALPDKITSENLELSKNIQMAKKMRNNGFDVYLLSNPRSGKSADFIFAKDGKTYYTEGKLSTGKNSLGHNLSKGGSQSERILVDITGTNDTNYIASRLMDAFQGNNELKEVMLLKGGRLIQIKSQDVAGNNFTQKFKKIWEKRK